MILDEITLGGTEAFDGEIVVPPSKKASAPISY